MLDALHLRNYKSYRESVEIPLSRLSVLLGKNNSGKTAAARLPLLLLAAATNRNATAAPLPTRVDGVVFASNVSEMSHGRFAHGDFSLGYAMDGRLGTSKEVNFTVQLLQDIRTGNSSFVSRWASNLLAGEVSWIEGPRTDGRAVRYSSGVQEFQGIFPLYLDPAARETIEELRLSGESAYRGLLHLISMRSPLGTVYETRQAEPTMDINGSEIPYLLREFPELMDAVSDWYANELNIDGIRIEAEATSFHLAAGSGTSASHNLARVGQGIQQVLPIAGYLKGVEYGYVNKNMVVLEEPELHLHPAAHGAVANLVVSALSAKPELQVIIETHSENLVLRLRQKVASGELSPEDINILWFENDDDSTTVREIRVGEDGSVSDWPRGVFSEDLAEVRAIAQAARR